MPSQVGGYSRAWQFLGRMTVCEHLLWSVGRYILTSEMGVLFCKTWSEISLRFLWPKLKKMFVCHFLPTQQFTPLPKKIYGLKIRIFFFFFFFFFFALLFIYADSKMPLFHVLSLAHA